MSFFERFKGIIFLTLVILLWVSSATMIRLIFTSSDTDFPHPLFLTYYSTAFFTLYLIPVAARAIKLYCCKKLDQTYLEEQGGSDYQIKKEYRD